LSFVSRTAKWTYWVGEPEDSRRHLVRMANPLSETQPYLCSTLLPGLFACVNRNTSRSMDDLALFERGSVFRVADRTLTEAEATQSRDNAFAEATRRTGAVLRS